MYLEESIRRINDKLGILEGKQNIAVWGAAENTVRLFQYTDIAKYNIEIMIDNGKCGQTFWGKNIFSADQVNWDNIDVVVVSSFYREKEILNELKENFRFNGTVINLNWEGQEKPFYQHLMKSELEVPSKYRDIVLDNRKFYNIHSGKRCFILCTGPSIKLLDLRKLEGEYSIAASNFYMHKDYSIIKPSYYCLAGFTYTDLFTEEVGTKHLQEIEQKAGDIQFFYSINEKKLIEKYNMFEGKKVNYLYFTSIGQEYEHIDLTLKTMNVQSVPIMCLEIAIYMGFQEIYLIGTEHSELTTKEYKYFYERDQNVTGHADKSVSNDGTIMGSYKRFLPGLYRLWEQYKIIKSIAERKNIQIYNATVGGELDLFERVNYDSLL